MEVSVHFLSLSDGRPEDVDEKSCLSRARWSHHSKSVVLYYLELAEGTLFSCVIESFLILFDLGLQGLLCHETRMWPLVVLAEVSNTVLKTVEVQSQSHRVSILGPSHARVGMVREGIEMTEYLGVELMSSSRLEETSVLKATLGLRKRRRVPDINGDNGKVITLVARKTMEEKT